MRSKWKRILLNLGTDIVLAGVVLIVFALFHHVIPRQQESVGIVIAPPSAAAETTAVDRAAESKPDPVPANGTEASPSETQKEKAGSTRPPRQTVLADSFEENPGSRRTSRSRNRNPGNNGFSEKGGSAVAEGFTSTGEETESEPMENKFPDKYTEEVVFTEDSYTSPNVSVKVSEETTADGRVIYYLADIYLRDVTSLRTALANNTYGSGYRDEIAAMAILNNALVAVNGDYYGNTTEGVVIRNGVIYRANDTDCDVCVVYYDGTMRVIAGSDFSVEDAIEDGAWQAWTFGPALLDANGGAISNFSSSRRLISANPRTAIGYYEPGHYCLVVVDGRGESSGMTMQELSQLFESLGCSVAYNLDGGNSSVMVWNGEVINDPSGGGRASSDAVLITEVTE